MKWLFPAVLVMYVLTAFGQHNDCANQLLSYTGYQESPDQKWNLSLQKANHTMLYYFGAEHSKDTSQQQFASILQHWQQVKPTIALFEGPDRGVFSTAGETISKLGESGYVRFLAKTDSIPVMSLEPSPDAEISYLNTRFPAGQVKLFFCLREAQQVRDRNHFDKEKVARHIAQLLVKANRLPYMQDTLTTIADIEAACKHYWGGKMEWWQVPATWFTPEKTSAETGGLFTNEINRMSSEFRNLHMYRLITRLLKEGKTVFAVVGRNHIPMQAKALECRWQQMLLEDR